MVPILFLPLSGATMAVHWSLIRKRSHYPSDVIAGGALGILVALAGWKLFPPKKTEDNAQEVVPEGEAQEGEPLDPAPDAAAPETAVTAT